jgi:transcriptional regulator with XRE-family HTH domain
MAGPRHQQLAIFLFAMALLSITHSLIDVRLRQYLHVENAMKDPQAFDIFKERLKKARDMRGLNQTDLANRAGLPPSSVSHFESGPRKPSFENLKRLAGALNVTTDYLLGRVDSPEASAPVGRLHRDIHKLSADDLKLAEEFVDMLVRRGKSPETK